MSCPHCGFGRDFDGEETPWNAVEKTLSWYADRVREEGGEGLAVHFFGGEPTLSRQLLVRTVERTRELAETGGLQTRFEIATNGLMNRSMATWLKGHMDSVILSLDGAQEDHNRPRPGRGGAGTFLDVMKTAQILDSGDLELHLRICVTAASLGRVPETVEWLLGRLQPNSIAIEPVVAEANAPAGLAPPSPTEFVRHFSTVADLAENVGIDTRFSSCTGPYARGAHCPVGQDSLILHPDGTLAACYLPAANWKDRGLSLELGVVAEGVKIEASAVGAVRRIATEKTRCDQCFARWSCGGGCHVSLSHPGAALGSTDFCRETRLLLLRRLLKDLGRPELWEAILDDDALFEDLSVLKEDRLAHLSEFHQGGAH